MGCASSSVEDLAAAARSRAIEKELAEDRNELR